MLNGISTTTGRGLRKPAGVARGARRLVGFERCYSCASCGGERHSWSRMTSCPDCGEAYVAAVIRRAAISAA